MMSGDTVSSRERTVGSIEHPVADRQPRRVGTDRPHPADPARPRHDRQFEQILALAAEHLAGIGEHPRGHDIDDHLAGAEHGIGHGLDGERRAERLQDGCFHESPRFRDGPFCRPGLCSFRPGIILGLTGLHEDDTAQRIGRFPPLPAAAAPPEAVGLPATRRRRTPGLRREEVAELAGIGVDWYVRLEQGRDVNPSLMTIDALARALKLGKSEHRHLRTLARHGDQRAFATETVPEAVLRVVESLPHPAYVAGRRWDVLAWNKAAEEIFAWGRMPEGERNTLLCMLTNPADPPPVRQQAGPTRRGAWWRSSAKTHDLWAGDPAFVELLDRLRTGSPEFAGWWKAHDIRDGSAGIKKMVHPKKGALRFQHASFQCNDDPGLKLVIYTPV